MSEIGTKPTGTDNDLANLDWAETAAGGRVAEPIASSRNSGWLLEQIPPSNWVNWFWRLAARAIQWMTATNVRAFTDLEDATDATIAEPLVTGEVFRVDRRPGDGGSDQVAPLTEVWSIAGSASTAVRIVSDAQYVYYSQGSVLRRADRATGSELAARDFGAQINDVAVSGAAVVLVTDNVGGSEAFRVDRLTLADLANWPLEATGNGEHIDTNSWRVVYSDTSTSIQIIDAVGGTTVASPVYGAAVYDVCVDYQRAYVVGADAGAGVQLRAYALSNGALDWSATIDVNPAGTAVMNAIFADGERVYIAGTTTTGVGATTWSLSAIGREDGVKIWQVDTGGTNVQHMAVDEAYVWIVNDNEELCQYDKRTGSLIKRLSHTGGLSAVDTDADSVFISGDAGLDTKRLRRLDRGNTSKAFSIASGTNPNRRPFYKLALPMDLQ